MKDLVLLGKVLKPHGVEGALRVEFEIPLGEKALKPGNALFLEDKSRQAIPYFIEQVRGAFPDMIIKFEDINTKELAIGLSNMKVYIKSKDLGSGSQAVLSTAEHYQYLEGYTALDVSGKPLGQLVEVVAYPKQEMGVLDSAGQEILIPLNPVFVTRVDKETKQVWLSLPEGLLELNQ